MTGNLKRFCQFHRRQFDTLLPELSVYEMLLYTAELKCPISVSRFSMTAEP